MNEADLVKRLRMLKARETSLKEELKQITEDLITTKETLLDYMESIGIDETANYTGIGKVKLTKPKVKAWVSAENLDLLCDYLRDIGREDLIKTSVHHMSLCKFAEEQIECQEDLPEFLNTQLIPELRLYKDKE